MELVEIRLLSDDLERTTRFYAGKLGFEVSQRDSHRVTFIAGNSKLVFTASEISRPVYHFAFNIPYGSIGDAHNWLAERTSLIRDGDSEIIEFPAWNARALYFYDNNGNILEFIGRKALDLPSAKRFEPAEIHSISEIGIVADDLEKLAGDYFRNYGIGTFVRQPLSENFGALGDDNGLLIISQPGRHWFPTKIAAENFYTEIRLRINDKIHELTVN